MIETLDRKLEDRSDNPAPYRAWTREEVLELLHNKIDGVRVFDREPNAEDVVLTLKPDSLRPEELGWNADVHLSREPRRWSYVFEELAIIAESVGWENGLNVFLMPEYKPTAEI